jgi:acyl-homoserine lactone acylase PvdQ
MLIPRCLVGALLAPCAFSLLTVACSGSSAETTTAASPYYRNLLPLWTEDQYFPMAFSRALVDQKTAHTLTLQP